MKWVAVIALGLLIGGAAACAWLSGCGREERTKRRESR